MDEQKIKYIFLGNAKEKTDLGEYPVKPNTTTKSDSLKIFQTYCNDDINQKHDQRNRVNQNNLRIYFTISSNDVFQLAVVESDYSEKLIFQLFEEITKENLHLLISREGKLNNLGKNKLQELVQTYQNETGVNQIKDINKDLDDIKVTMKKNMQNVVGNLESVNILDEKSRKIKDGSSAFYKDSNKLKKLACCQNWKWTILIILVVLGILLVVVLSATLGAKSTKAVIDSNNQNGTGNA